MVIINKNEIMENCICGNPILESGTRKCGRCNLYIDKDNHIKLTNPTNDGWEDLWTMIPDDELHNMASCMLSILDSLKLYDNDSLELGDETLSEMMFRKMRGYNIDLNEELGFTHLKPISKKIS